MSTPVNPSAPFWRTKTLSEMTPEEWESLCDGCGRCCLHKLQDEDTGEISYTNVACLLLDVGRCCCKNYAQRQRYIPDCVRLTVEDLKDIVWLPTTCAYRLLASGEDLPHWHPLVSGDPHSVHAAGISVRGRAIPEDRAGPLEHHLVDWFT